MDSCYSILKRWQNRQGTFSPWDKRWTNFQLTVCVWPLLTLVTRWKMRILLKKWPTLEFYVFSHFLSGQRIDRTRRHAIQRAVPVRFYSKEMKHLKCVIDHHGYRVFNNELTLMERFRLQ
ncbi:uncharacterized protein [Montipora capricornis]|uniref:uncharacterized protein n=1 Tax=Montipora capricornis TaxID=246305 RepID=UPI0035F11E53